MNALRRYGAGPFQAAVIHGGPGAPGEMAPVAKELSSGFGVLEPLQTADSVAGQVAELAAILERHADVPVTLIGHSWGAWLSYLIAAAYPNLIKKLILIGSGPFEAKYTPMVQERRMLRLTEAERCRVLELQEALNGSAMRDRSDLFQEFGALMSKADAFDPFPPESTKIKVQQEIFQKVFGEAQAMRKSGELLELGRKVTCPVLALHGDYDPHPVEGVAEPLPRVLKDFRMIVLKDCGHTPWLERRARERFYAIIRDELAANLTLRKAIEFVGTP
jgi:pimeloyl-ACP methyl ester carboxylesterase